MIYFLSKKLIKPLPTFSHAVIHNNLIYTSCIQGFLNSGELPANIEEEARQMFLNLKTLLEECDSNLSQILKMTLFFSDLERDFLVVNQVINNLFSNSPARSSIGVKELPRACKIVVECIAIKIN
jgi:2-iminobutanoate/2-iminopropanoate deaminase